MGCSHRSARLGGHGSTHWGSWGSAPGPTLRPLPQGRGLASTVLCLSAHFPRELVPAPMDPGLLPAPRLRPWREGQRPGVWLSREVAPGWQAPPICRKGVSFSVLALPPAGAADSAWGSPLLRVPSFLDVPSLAAPHRAVPAVRPEQGAFSHAPGLSVPPGLGDTVRRPLCHLLALWQHTRLCPPHVSRSCRGSCSPAAGLGGLLGPCWASSGCTGDPFPPVTPLGRGSVR